MIRRSRTPRHRYQRRRSRTWVVPLAVGAGALVAVAGVAVVLAQMWGRPGVTVTASPLAMFDVRVSGLGTKLTNGQATTAGRPVALVRTADGLVPSHALAQGQVVEVTATATPPSWLRWLVGGRVTVTKTLRTPAATTTASVALASRPGVVPVRFDHPVSVVDYRTAGGPAQVLHLARPATTAKLAVPSQAAAGSLEVAAAPLPWETVSSHTSAVTWFVAPAGAGPLALADPAPGTATAAPNAPITLTFAQPVASVLGAARPTVSPAVSGTWSEPAANVLVFTPNGFGFGPGAAVTVSFGRPVTVVGASASDRLAAATTAYQFSVAPGSLVRLEQILAQLHYLPLQFRPAAGVTLPTTFVEEVATMSQPLAGSLSWRWASTPASLQAQWTVGSPNPLVKGALMAFLSTQGSYDGYQVDPETVAQLADASTWNALLQAAASNQLDPSPYSYVYVTQSLPETLTLWEDGSNVLTSLANTGIPDRPTADGTFPVYVRYAQNHMRGTNPDGSTYDDLVFWINYFNGGDAVHGFVRGSYGYPQSLGCVELPLPTAAVAFSELAVGDLVTVAN
jgi:L,D-transpeptidase catalytic domain